MRNFTINVSLVLVSLILTLLVFEAVLRVWTGVPVFQALDSREAQQTRNLVGCGNGFDPELGWKPVPFRSGVNTGGGQVNILPTGIRSNGAPRPGGSFIVLAVGDSYTFGAQVNDDQSWPAALERRLNRPVLNGGVCGYGIGQSVRRAEILARRFGPDVLILAMIPTDIDRTRASSFYGRKKPYFKAAGGQLTYHSEHLSGSLVDVATSQGKTSLVRMISDFMGIRSVLWQTLPNVPRLMDMLQSRIALMRGTAHTYFTSDGVGLSCRVATRLRSFGEEYGATTLLVIQYKFRDILNRMALEEGRADRSDSPDIEVVAKTIDLIECANQAGIEVVDTYAPLRDIYVSRGRAALTALYSDHMSPKGNEFVAELIAPALADR